MEIIDLNTWPRREIYQLFSRSPWPFVSVTMPVDVTAVKAVSKARGLSFYHTMIWLCTKAVNAVPAFRVRIRDGRPVRLDATHPSFTHIDPGSEAFRIIDLPWEADLAAFCRRAKAKVDSQRVFLDAAGQTDALIYFSCTPWFDFCGLSGDHGGGNDDLIPKLTWGQYFEDKGRLWVHLALEVNHRAVDGYHIGQFKQALDREIAALAGSEKEGEEP